MPDKSKDAPRGLYEWRGNPAKSEAATAAPRATELGASNGPFSKRCDLCHGPAQKVAGGWWCDACNTGSTRDA